MTRGLLTVSEYAAKAEAQLQWFLDHTKHDKVPALTTEQWRIASCTWLLISKGVVLPHIKNNVKNWLVCQSVRNEIQNYIRLRKLTMEIAAEALNVNNELDEFYRVDAERPVLSHG